MTIVYNIIINFSLDALVLNQHAAQLKKWLKLERLV